MLEHILLINSAGVVLYSKEFVGSLQQHRMVGSLIMSILKFSTDCCRLPVSYMEMTNTALSIVSDEKTNVVCVAFHDTGFGREFGRMLASSILHSFVSNYSVAVQDDFNQTQNLKVFQSFSGKLVEAIRSTAKSIVNSLVLQKGVVKVILVVNDTIACTTQTVDELAVVANLQSLVTRCVDAMALQHDVANELVLEGSTARVFVTRLPDTEAILVVVSKRSAEVDALTASIATAAFQLVNLYRIISSYDNSGKW